MRDMAQQVDAGIFQAALLQIAEATQAAANAAQAAQQVAASTTTTAASSGAGTGGAVTVKAQATPIRNKTNGTLGTGYGN